MKETIKDPSAAPPGFKIVVFYTLVFSLAAHAYMYFSLALSHDSLDMIFTVPAPSTELVTGRFMIPLYWLIRGSYPVPWLVGMLATLFICLSVCFLAAALDIVRKSSLIILCGVLSTCLTVTTINATYMYCADSYMLALLLACAGVWLWERYPDKRGVLAAMPLFALSMGLYQAFFDVAIGMALILLIKAVMDGEAFPVLWKRALRYALSLLGGGALYFVLVKCVALLTRTHLLTDYNYNGLYQFFEAGSLSPLSMLRQIPYAYFNFAAFFFSPLRAHNTPALCLLRLAMIFFGLCMWVRRIRRQHIRGPELAVLLLCAALLPLGLNFVCVLNNGMMHMLMTYSYYLIYIPLLLPLGSSPAEEAEEAGSPGRRGRWPRFCSGAVLCLCAYMIFHNIVFANGAYYYKRIVYDASSRYAFSIAETIERQPDYEPGVTPVLFVGSFQDSNVARAEDDSFAQYRNVTGMASGTSVTYEDTFRVFSSSLLGHPINITVPSPQREELLSLPAVQDMPVFPQDGYCRLIDGVIVVKLS